MRIQDFLTIHQNVNGSAAVSAILHKRYGRGVNSFWLSHGEEKYPVLSILVNGDLASLYYLRQEGHPGFTSIGDVKGLQSEQTSTFFMNSVNEKHEVPNDSIVPFHLALKAAVEFSRSKSLPGSIEWFEL